MISPRSTSLIGALLLLNAIALSVPALGMPELDPPCAYRNPVLCAELPRDGAELDAVLRAPVNSLAAWKRQIYFDMPFLVLYAALIGLTALRDGQRAGRQRWAGAAAVCLGVGAMLDAIENTGILVGLSAVEAGEVVSDGTATWVRLAAFTKFQLLCLGSAIALGLAALRVGWAARGAIALGIAACLAAGFGAWWPTGIELGALGIAVACLVAWTRSGLAWRRDARGMRQEPGDSRIQ